MLQQMENEAKIFARGIHLHLKYSQNKYIWKCAALPFFPPPLLLLLLPLSIRQYVSHSLTHSLCQTLRIRNVTKYHCRCCCYSYGMCLVYFIYYFTHSLGAKRDFMYRTTFYGNLLCIFCPVVCEARTMYRICVNNGNFSGFFFG